MPDVFKVVHQKDGQWDTFILRGNIDIHTGDELASIPAAITGTSVRFDFSEVGRINSSGIAHLLRCFKNIHDTGTSEVFLSGLSTIHTMLFKTTGVFLLAKPETAVQ